MNINERSKLVVVVVVVVFIIFMNLPDSSFS